MKSFKSFLMLTLLASVTGIYASSQDEILIKFTKEEVQSRLRTLGLSHFMEKTDIVDSLSDSEKVPFGIAMAVELAYADYYEYMSKGQPAPMFRMTQIQMEMHKPLIYRALLQDKPAALTELEQAGMYNPRK